MTHRRLLVLCRLALLASSACTITTGQAPAPAAPAPAPIAPASPAPPPQAIPVAPPPAPAPIAPAPIAQAPIAQAPYRPAPIAPAPIAPAAIAPAPYRPAPGAVPPAPLTRAPIAPAATPALPPAAPVVERQTSPRVLHGPPFLPTPEPRERPAEHPRGAALGMPRDLREARVDGLWVWHDERASDWHLRASTHGQGRRYNGRVWLDEGAFADVRPSRSEWSDRLRASVRAIEFDFPTQAGADGFEFRIANARCVHFVLYMDGRPDPAAIHVGAGSSHPFRHTFTVCP